MTVIRSYGHSCFSVEADNGWTAVFDPYKDGSVPGLKLPSLTADAVFASHDHADHNAVSLIQLRAEHPCPYEVSTLLTDHDEEGGRLRGKNRITILTNDHEKIAHFGDLGRDLSLMEESALADAAVILIPCGGFYTIDAQLAGKIIEKLRPKLAVLMHYRTDSSGYDVLLSAEEVKRAIPEARFLNTEEALLGRENGIIALSAKQ